MQLAILGRQPKISLAELESLFGAEKVIEVSDEAALVDIEEPLPQPRLGGTMKSAKVLTRLENTDLQDTFRYLEKSVPDHLQYLPEGKLQLGLSAYGFDVSAKSVTKQVLSLKKIIKNAGRSVRIIENKQPALESAQVLYNKLTGPLGWEILIVQDGKDVVLAQTTGVQNVDDYSKRDFDRPKRDAYVGMLPPKLAQIMINLAVGLTSTLNSNGLDVVQGSKEEQVSRTNSTMSERQTPADAAIRQEAYQATSSARRQDKPSITILDPFCGTGVVLQEGYLMGFDVSGSDIDPRMVEYSKENMRWIDKKYGVGNGGEIDSAYAVSVADATKTSFKPKSPDGFSAVVCETYLGKPLASLPKPDKLDLIIKEANEIAEEFLKNIHPQLKKGTRLCLALPAWYIASQNSKFQIPNSNFRHLPVLDQIANLGYNRLDLKHATREDLIYHRSDQVVARELTILEKV